MRYLVDNKIGGYIRVRPGLVLEPYGIVCGPFIVLTWKNADLLHFHNIDLLL